LHELFSVRDTSPNGDLVVLISDTSHVYLPETTTSHRLIERRYSIHPSPKSMGTTIKQTLVSAKSETFEYAAFVHGSRSSLLYPLLVRQQWRFDGDNILKARDKDNIVLIDEYDERLTTFLSVVWVMGPETPVPKSRMRLKVQRFREFSLATSYTHLPTRPPDCGSTITITTSPARVNGGDVTWTHPKAGPINWHEFEEYNQELFRMLQTNMLNAMFERDGFDGDLLLRVGSTRGFRYWLKD
jgi:hypothetical protein